jgi:rare lipoprotein A
MVDQAFRVAAVVLAVLTTAVACVGHSQPTTEAHKGRYVETGIASWYGRPYHGRKTASGERYDMREMTAAHKTLPFGAKVKVTDLETGRSIKVRITDRGPFVEGRIIDLSRKAAKQLGMYKRGITRVRIETKL